MFEKNYKIIDLTLPVVNNMSVPFTARKGRPPVSITRARCHENDGFQSSLFQSGIHVGTHLDAPLHMIAGGDTIDVIPLDHFFGQAYCVDCSEVEPNGHITAEVLSKAEGAVRPGMIVLLYTGWSDAKFGTDEYWSDSPVLGASGAQWLVDHGAKMAGYDFFQEEAAKADHAEPAKYVAHKILLSHNCLNIEHMTNMKELVGKEFFLCAFPLRLKDTEGSPTRAIAFLPSEEN